MGRRIPCSVEEIELENGDGYLISGLQVTCDECGLTAEVFGTSLASARRGAVMLREQCDSQHFYVVPDDVDQWE